MKMKKFDKLFSFIIIETILFILPLLTFWWSFYLLEWNIFFGVAIAIMVIIILNIILLKNLIKNFYNINKFLLMLMHLFYSVCIFGFFMGVPIFNVIPGILSGIYIGRKSGINNYSTKVFNDKLLKYNIFSSIVLTLICFCSAYIALTDKYTASNLEGMFNLNFHITNSMLWIIIILGAIILLLIQYFVSIFVSKKAYKKL